MEGSNIYGMTLEDFFDLLEQEHCWNDLIVRVAYKYDHEKEYTITNEILTHDYPTDTYIWENDWNEGQQDVYILGFIKVEDIDIPGFKSGVMVYEPLYDEKVIDKILEEGKLELPGVICTIEELKNMNGKD